MSWTITQEEDERGSLFVLTNNGNFVGSFRTLAGCAMFLERQERRVMMENAKPEDRRRWILDKAEDTR